MVKMSVRSDRVCKRPWNFERVPNKMIEGHDKALIFTSTKEACLAACLNEVSVVPRLPSPHPLRHATADTPHHHTQHDIRNISISAFQIQQQEQLELF